ncbi:MAG: transporter substrate-binding domain-containing protein [Chloroflexi bacterium]|nr:transporter substrate-binding domain-containing protein [Chloroflexota bacterium]
MLVIVFLIGMCLTACSGQSAPTQSLNLQAALQSKLRIGVDANYPSFVIVDPNNVGFVGFDIEVMKAIAAKSGLDIEFVNVGPNQLTTYIGRCQLDVGISAVAITDQLKQQMLFSDPYYTTGQVIVVKKGNITITSRSTLASMAVGTQAKTLSASEIGNIAGVRLIAYPSYDVAFQSLIPGYIDAVIADKPRALGYVKIKSNNLKIVGEEFGSVNLGIAICRTRADLATKINTGLAAVKADGTINRLAQKWLDKSNQ